SQGLKEAGYVEGQNFAVEYSWAEGHFERLPGLAAELVNLQVALIVAACNAAAPAAKAATATIPIVVVVAGDPVRLGLLASLNRPGGNVTGMTGLENMLAPKLLELLHELTPTVTLIACLVNPDNPNAQADVRDVQEAARVLGLQLIVGKAHNTQEVDEAFAT